MRPPEKRSAPPGEDGRGMSPGNDEAPGATRGQKTEDVVVGSSLVDGRDNGQTPWPWIEGPIDPSTLTVEQYERLPREGKANLPNEDIARLEAELDQRAATVDADNEPRIEYDDDDGAEAFRRRVDAGDPEQQDDPEQWEDSNLTDEERQAKRFTDGIVSGKSILELPKPDSMVGTWLDRGMLAQLVGAYGSAKTFVALELGLSVTTGRPWFGQPIHHRGQVLYIAAEGGYTFPDRAQGWIEDTGRDLPDDFLLYPHRFDITDGGVVGHSGLWQPLQNALTLGLIAPSLVILDTRSRLVSGDENSIEPSTRLTQACDIIRDLVPKVTIVVIHHPGHNVTGRGRGHSSFEDNLDVVWSITGRLKDGPVQLTDEKQKARAQNEDGIWLTLTTTDTGLPRLVVTAEPVDDDEDNERVIRAKILETVEAHPGRCTVSDLFKRESKFYVGGRPKVEQTVKLLLAGNEIVTREHRHEDTDRKADRLFPAAVPLFPDRSLLHNNTGDMQ